MKQGPLKELTPLIRAMLGDETCPQEVLRDALLDEGMDVAKVYVIGGTTGEYSSARVWDVCGFLDRAKAEEFLALLISWSKEHWVHASNHKDMPWEYEEPTRCPYDPDFYCSYTGVEYVIMELDLKG